MRNVINGNVEKGPMSETIATCSQCNKNIELPPRLQKMFLMSKRLPDKILCAQCSAFNKKDSVVKIEEKQDNLNCCAETRCQYLLLSPSLACYKYKDSSGMPTLLNKNYTKGCVPMLSCCDRKVL
jgi:hypothetical protein